MRKNILTMSCIGVLCVSMGMRPSQAALMFPDTDATVSYSFFGFDGLVAGSSIGFLIADTGGDGFVGQTDPDGSAASLLGVTSLGRGDQLGDDLILGKFTALSVGGPVGFDSNGKLGLDYGVGGLAVGQDLSLLYFTTGTSVAGDPYHFYRSAAITDPGINGNIGYVTPTSGDSNSIVSVRDTVTFFGPAGGVSQGDVITAAVPEPSGALLAMLAVLGGILREGSRQRCRRRHAAWDTAASR